MPGTGEGRAGRMDSVSEKMERFIFRRKEGWGEKKS